jgi:hypothetical protein
VCVCVCAWFQKQSSDRRRIRIRVRWLEAKSQGFGKCEGGSGSASSVAAGGPAPSSIIPEGQGMCMQGPDSTRGLKSDTRHTSLKERCVRVQYLPASRISWSLEVSLSS